MLNCLISISCPLSSSYVFLLLCYDPERFGQGCLAFGPPHVPLSIRVRQSMSHRGDFPLAPLRRSLNGVIEQMEKFSSDLHDLSHKVEATHHTTSQELAMGARQRDKQLKGMSAIPLC